MSTISANDRYNLAYNYVSALLIEEQSECFYNVRDLQIIQKDNIQFPHFMNVSFVVDAILDSEKCCLRTREEFQATPNEWINIEVHVSLYWSYDNMADQFHICNTGYPNVSLFSISRTDPKYREDHDTEYFDRVITGFFKNFIVNRHTGYTTTYGDNIYQQAAKFRNTWSIVLAHEVPIIHVNDDGKVYYVEESEKDIMRKIKDFVSHHMDNVYCDDRDPLVLLDNNDYYIVSVALKIDINETATTFFVSHNPYEDDEIIENDTWLGVLTFNFDIKKRECDVSTIVLTPRDYDYHYIRAIEEEIDIEFRRLGAEKTYTKLTGNPYPMITGSCPVPTTPSIVIPNNVCKEIVLDVNDKSTVNNFLVF